MTTTALEPAPPVVVVYPDSDGEPMADNSVQYRWIATLKWGLEHQYRAAPEVFVAGDHLIYPVEGDADTKQAPDVYVAFGRPKGDRGSYKVWQEDGVFPQVVVEVWSPHNTADQMTQRMGFYQRYGVEEFYIVYPAFPAYVAAWRRDGNRLARVDRPAGWTSPRLGIRFEVTEGRLAVYGADGRPFLPPDEVAAERDAAEARADEQARLAATEQARADRLAAKLRDLGLDPDAV